ncbi:MAG: tetratricopeptide repeat protein [Myxococcota bacterium]|nr:tetratricopeptide repeat protein [Myxococcota bacterium]
MSLGALDGLEQIFTRLDEPSRLAEVLAARARALSSRPAERKQVLGRLGALYAGRLGRRDLAREAYRQALALDPTYHPGLIFLAEDAHKRGDHGAELAHLKRLASLDAQAPLSAAERAEIHARLAQLHRRAGRHEEAERQALLALRYDPEHAQALALLDERYSASGRHAELAEILLRRAHVEQEAVERRDALVRRAGLLDEGLGNPQLALQAYHDLVRLAPDPAACIRLAELAAQQQAFDEIQDVAPVVGRALLDNSRAAEAIPVLLAAARRGAGEPLFALLAEAYEAIGDSDRAADAWSAAGRAADPVRRAEALVKAGRLEEAMAAWVSIASSEPALAEQARRSAATLARQAMVEHPEEAPAWARRLLEVEPQDAEALALCLRARPTEAAGLLDALGSRLATEEAAATWHAAALLLPESEQEMRRELLRRSVAVAPTPQRVLLLASLEEGPRRRQVLEAGQARFPSDPDLALALAEAAPDSALAVLEQAIAAQEGHADDGARHARTRLLCAAARWAREAGDRRAARAFLRRAGEAEEALHALVDLDRERLLEAAEGDEDDLLPVLTQLRERKLATPEELRALARLLTARGQYAEAARLHREAGGEPDELLADLETSGRYRELLVALAEHAAVLPEQARRLHRYGARIAEHHLGDRHQAAVLLEQAAFSQGPQEEAAELWAQAGALWNQLGQRERGAAALGRALTAGGEKTPGVLLALADYSFDEGDWDSAARHYRRALAVGQVPGPERGRVRLRLAAIERRRGNAVAEEQELAAAVEAGAGAQAWPALAALFRSQGEMARLGAALLAWADYESGESRLSLLRQAGALVGPTLLPRVDDELIRLDADDETVRDRVLARLRQGGDAQALAAALARDVKKSTGLRRVAAARELAALCEQLGDIVATARAWSEVLQASPEADRDAQEALGWLLRLHQAGVALPPEAMAELRVHLLERGRLQAYLAALEAEAERCRDHNPTHRAELLRMAAELCEALDDAAGAAGRWLRLCTAQGESGEALTRARHQLRRLCESERAEEALQLVEDELRRGGPGGAVGLRVAQAEILAHLGRPEEAIGHLDLALVHEPDSGPAHALLGLLLAQSSQPLESARGLPHLLLAVGAPDVEPHEAGECALCAAEILMARVDHDPHLASQLTPGTERPDPRWLLERAAELLPGDRRPLDALLHLAVEQGQDDRAVLLLEQLLHLVHEDTERSRLLVEQAAILTRLGRLDEAEAAASQAVRLSPQMYEARRAQRLVWARRGQSQQAELHCHRELEGVEDPSLRATLLLELALLRQERGDMEGAIQACVEGGQLGSSAACQEAFRILSSLGRHVEAADLAVRASHHLEEAQAGPMLLAAAAMAQKAGDVERARTCLEQACGLPSVALEAQHQLLVLEGGSDPASQRQALLSRLVEAQGQMRLALLRRLLLLALETNDDAEARVWAAELFQHSPDDDLAFRVHHRLLSQDGDPLALCQMWLRRAEGLTEPLARADALCTAASIASESLGDLTMAERHYQMALEALPGHLSAVFGLADLAYRRGDYERARALYESIPEVPPGCPDAGEILRRRGELAEAAGNQDGALSAYRQMLEVGLRLREASPSTGLDEVGAALAPDIIVRAAEELTRLHQQRGEYGEALCALRHLLPYMPEGDAEESRTRRAHLWLHLAWLALQAGELAEAESHLGGLLASDPDSRQGLLLLVELYHAMGRPLEAAQVLSRLAELAESPAERADMLYERGALIEVHLGDPAQSFQMYQQALEAVPGHAPSLRRLIVLHLREANGVGVAEAVRELEEAGQGLEDVQYLGGIGMALAGENEQADRLLRGASAEQLAQALSAIGLPPPGDLSLLDEPIAAAVRALGGTAGLPALEAALYDRLRAAPSGVDVGARQILARLAELRGEPRARVHLSVLAFLLPDGYAAQRLEVLGPAPPRTLGADPFLSSGPNPLRDALAVLGQHLHGFPEAALPLSADWGLRLRSLGHAVGLAKLDVAIVETLPAGEEPARCDPTHPPRLRLLRRLTADPAQARFAALRALRLLQFGVPLVQGRSPAEVAALLRATAWLLEPTPTPPQDPLVDSWISTLRSLPFPLESFPPKVRAEARAALSACCEQLATEPSYLETALPDFVESAQRAAERQAWAETGDLLAALRALAPWPLDEPTARLTALQMPALVQLIGFADQQS